MLTYVFAVLAACANAVSSVLQRKANRDLPEEDGLRPRLVLELMRKPVWFAGVAGVIAGFLLQAAALGSGELSAVEPIMVLELPLTLMLAAWVFRSGMSRREWSAVLGMTAGLAVMLYFLAPSPGTSGPVPWQAWVAGVAVNLAVVAGAVQFGRRGPPGGGGRRATSYGVAAGSQFGLTAALIKAVTGRYASGFGALFTGWQLYAMVLSGLLGMLLLQSAMHAGSLIAAQPGLTLSDPLVSMLWGVVVFKEDVQTDLRLLPAVAGGLLMALSVFVLTRSPVLGPGGGPAQSRPPAETTRL